MVCLWQKMIAAPAGHGFFPFLSAIITRCFVERILCFKLLRLLCRWAEKESVSSWCRKLRSPGDAFRNCNFLQRSESGRKEVVIGVSICGWSREIINPQGVTFLMKTGNRSAFIIYGITRHLKTDFSMAMKKNIWQVISFPASFSLSEFCQTIFEKIVRNFRMLN